MRKTILVFMCALFFVGNVWAADDTVTIAHIDAFSGPFQELGERMNMAVKYAVADINAAGGLLGKKVILVSEDSQLKPDIAARKAEKVITQDGAKFIVSNMSTAVTRSILQVSEKHNVIQMASAIYGSNMTGEDFSRNFFRTCYNSAVWARALAAFFKTQPYRKFYLLNQDYVFGHIVSKDFQDALKKELPDAQIVGNDYHPVATKDFAPYISKVKASKAEIVFSANYSVDLSNLIKQSNQLGLKAVFVSNQLDDPVILSKVGNAAVGAIALSMYLPTVNTKANKEFVAKWNKQFKNTDNPYPSYLIAPIYDGLKFFFAAVKKAGSFDPDKIIKAWEGMEYKGLTGKVQMRACDHQLIQPLFLSVIEKKSALYPFPYNGSPIQVIGTDKSAVPPTETGNKRCN